MWLWVLIALLLAAAVIGVGLIQRAGRGHESEAEPELVESLDPSRRQELIRGTSLHLREMRYRYSVRIDRGDRAPFTTDVNSIKLGFVPVVISDNASERQGTGYAAFVYDGQRWCGPGLPCAGSPRDAVDHARRCVAPLEGAKSRRLEDLKT